MSHTQPMIHFKATLMGYVVLYYIGKVNIRKFVSRVP